MWAAKLAASLDTMCVTPGTLPRSFIFVTRPQPPEPGFPRFIPINLVPPHSSLRWCSTSPMLGRFLQTPSRDGSQFLRLSALLQFVKETWHLFYFILHYRCVSADLWTVGINTPLDPMVSRLRFSSTNKKAKECVCPCPWSVRRHSLWHFYNNETETSLCGYEWAPSYFQYSQ